MNVTVDTSALDTREAERYFTKNEHRMASFRGALELLGLPFPAWAMRKPSGRKPSISVAAAYRADNPETLHQATMRKSADHKAKLTTPATPAYADPLATAPINEGPLAQQVFG